MKLPDRDIHNHLLPGVDDGFRHDEDSLRAIEKMAAAGVKEFIFTPHMNPDVYPEESEEHFKQVYADFSARIPAEWGVKTSLAAEYMVVNDFERRVEHPETLLHWPDGSILIAQIQAGGTGLNIQAASVVVFCEPQIKPSLETQAISRAYRMGQVRKVLVYRLLCDDSIDERIMERLREKQEQFDSFADESYSGRESLLLGELSEGALIDREIARITAGR